jgi:hypothetical protein
LNLTRDIVSVTRYLLEITTASEIAPAPVSHDRNDLNQVSTSDGKWRDAINQLCGKAVDLAASRKAGDAAVKPEPRAFTPRLSVPATLESYAC